MTLRAATRAGRHKLRHAGVLVFLVLRVYVSAAQDLAPRAYLITPIHSNAITVTYSNYRGDLLFDGAVPITGSTANVDTFVVTYTHSLHVFGRSANFSAGLPYGVGNFRGKVTGTEAYAYRSGGFDSVYRFSVNILGGPAMKLQDFRQWHQGTILGVSVKLVAPTGQYDPAKLINLGTNRWALKPELGFSRKLGNWLIDSYGAVWLYTANRDFLKLPGVSSEPNSQKQRPIFAFEGHLSYDIRPRLWASLDGNFWTGGRTSVNGVENPKTQQQNSRLGATVSVPLSKRQSVKFGYNRGAYIRYGGNYQTVSLAWQYSWLGTPN